jgi:hypothetical protein
MRTLLRSIAVNPVSISAVLCAAAAAQNWTLTSPPASPQPAILPCMAYDVARARSVMFGGWRSTPTGDVVFDQTWEYDGASWTLRAPATVPDERESHVMAFDVARGRTVMFGGWDFNFVRLGQTWEWDGTNWQNMLPANAPSPRTLAAMAYDTGRGVTVLFGGDDAFATRNDTWEWNGTTWVQRTPLASPPPRTSHAMAYDLARGRIVMFGGDDGLNVLGDTWEYDGTTWVQILTDGAPPARVGAQLVFDSGRGRCVLFGGADLATERNDTWEFDGVRWHQLFTANRPQGNAAMAMAYDLLRSRTVVFGGFDGIGAIADTWELGGNGATYRTFGTGCVGGGGLTPELVPQVVPSLGATTTVDVRQLPPGGGLVYVAAALSDTTWLGLPLPFDLSPAGLTGCRNYTSADVGIALTHTAGTATWSLAVPNNPALVGFQMFLQALSFDAAAPRPFPAAMSNAAELNVR